jgi:hypothetical protein
VVGRLRALESAVQRKVTASSVWADLNTAVAARSRYDIEAALACATAMSLSFPGVTDRAKVCVLPWLPCDSVPCVGAEHLAGGPSSLARLPSMLVTIVHCVC